MSKPCMRMRLPFAWSCPLYPRHGNAHAQAQGCSETHRRSRTRLCPDEHARMHTRQRNRPSHARTHAQTRTYPTMSLSAAFSLTCTCRSAHAAHCRMSTQANSHASGGGRHLCCACLPMQLRSRFTRSSILVREFSKVQVGTGGQPNADWLQRNGRACGTFIRNPQWQSAKMNTEETELLKRRPTNVAIATWHNTY